MKTNRIRNATRNIFYGMTNKTILIILPFIVRTVIIYVMGVQYLGLGSLFTSILSIMNLAELGFSSAIIFSMYRPIIEDDKETICALLNFYKKCYQIIGGIVLIIGLGIMPFLKYLINGDYPVEINLYFLYAIYLFNTVISYFLFAYKKALLNAHQRTDIDSNISSIFSVLQYIVQMALLLIFKNFYLYIIVLPIMTVANNLVSARVVNRLFPEYVCRGKLDHALYKSIQKKIGGLVFQKIGSVVLSSVDNIVISIFLGLIVLGIYNNYYFIITALFGILAIIMNSLIPGVGNSIALDSIEKNYNDFKKFNFIYVWIITWFSACLLCLYQDFMRIWVGEDLMLSMMMVILCVLYFYLHKCCDMVHIYKEATGLWWEGRFVPLIAAAVNLVLNIWLVMIIGLPGILVSTIISILIIYIPGDTYVLFKYYFTIKNGWRNYLGGQMLRMIVAVIICAITFVSCAFLPAYGIGWFLVKCIICAIFPNILLVIAYFHTKEFKEALNMGKEMISKKLITGKQSL